MKKKILVPIFGAVVLGLSAYVGYRTYGAYSEKELESDLLLANLEALAQDGESAGNSIDCYSQWKGVDSADADRTVYKCYPCGEEVTCEQALNPGKCTP